MLVMAFGRYEQPDDSIAAHSTISPTELVGRIRRGLERLTAAKSAATPSEAFPPAILLMANDRLTGHFNVRYFNRAAHFSLRYSRATIRPAKPERKVSQRFDLILV